MRKFIQAVEKFIRMEAQYPDVNLSWNKKQSFIKKLHRDVITKTYDERISASVAPEHIKDFFNDHPKTLTFSQKLFSMIDARGLDEVKTYQKANINRQLFSKIRSNENYQPSKATVMGFIIAMKLNEDDAQDLLNSAGFSFKLSSQFDLTILYFVRNEIDYTIDDVNTCLNHFNEPMIGL